MGAWTWKHFSTFDSDFQFQKQMLEQEQMHRSCSFSGAEKMQAYKSAFSTRSPGLHQALAGKTVEGPKVQCLELSKLMMI